MPSNTALVSGPAVWAAQTLIWSFSCCSCLQGLQLPGCVFSSAGTLGVLSYVQRHRVCSLIEWIQSSTCAAGGKVLSSPPQPHCPWVSTVAVSPPLPVRPPGGFAAETALEGVGLPPGGRGVGGAAAGAAGPGASGAQGNWRLGPQERAFSSLRQLCPSEDPAWGWHNCSDHGNSGGAEYAGTPAVSAEGALALPASHPHLWQLQSERLCGRSFSMHLAPSPVKAGKGQPLFGVFHCPGLTCGDREATAMAPWPVCDSSGPPCLHGCPGFLHRHFPLPPPPSHPLWRLPAVDS